MVKTDLGNIDASAAPLAVAQDNEHLGLLYCSTDAIHLWRLPLKRVAIVFILQSVSRPAQQVRAGELTMNAAQSSTEFAQMLL